MKQHLFCKSTHDHLSGVFTICFSCVVNAPRHYYLYCVMQNSHQSLKTVNSRSETHFAYVDFKPQNKTPNFGEQGLILTRVNSFPPPRWKFNFHDEMHHILMFLHVVGLVLISADYGWLSTPDAELITFGKGVSRPVKNRGKQDAKTQFVPLYYLPR